MKERPILFSGPMVRALLAGTKTQTRRLVKPQPVAVNPRECRLPALHRDGDCVWPDKDGGTTISCKPHGPDGWAAENSPYGQPGDRLWVRESWAPNTGSAGGFLYRADHGGAASFNRMDLKTGVWTHATSRWWPSIHMPRTASRLTLEITGVRVERLQDIHPADALQEGLEQCTDLPYRWDHPVCLQTAVKLYSELWEQINGPGSWDANPWVWVIDFKRIEQPQAAL